MCNRRSGRRLVAALDHGDRRRALAVLDHLPRLRLRHEVGQALRELDHLGRRLLGLLGARRRQFGLLRRLRLRGPERGLHVDRRRPEALQLRREALHLERRRLALLHRLLLSFAELLRERRKLVAQRAPAGPRLLSHLQLVQVLVHFERRGLAAHDGHQRAVDQDAAAHLGRGGELVDRLVQTPPVAHLALNEHPPRFLEPVRRGDLEDGDVAQLSAQHAQHRPRGGRVAELVHLEPGDDEHFLDRHFDVHPWVRRHARPDHHLRARVPGDAVVAQRAVRRRGQGAQREDVLLAAKRGADNRLVPAVLPKPRDVGVEARKVRHRPRVLHVVQIHGGGDLREPPHDRRRGPVAVEHDPSARPQRIERDREELRAGRTEQAAAHRLGDRPQPGGHAIGQGEVLHRPVLVAELGHRLGRGRPQLVRVIIDRDVRRHRHDHHLLPLHIAVLPQRHGLILLRPDIVRVVTVVEGRHATRFPSSYFDAPCAL